MKKCEVGGQAVIEGVMMRGTKGQATAVRTPKNKIEVDFQNILPITKRYKFINIPFIRGIFILIDSLIIGIKTLNFSASFFEDDEESKFELWLKNKLGEKSNDVIIGITMCISMILAICLFVALPTWIAAWFKVLKLSAVQLNLIEALMRVLILLIYMYSISKMDDIYRVFQYHGAEHKTIFCYEAEQELTVENVKKFSRFHPRCGTNFLFLIMIVSIAIFSFTGWQSFIERLILRIVLIPVVSGITYEIIRWLGKSDGKLSKAIAYPGLMLQKLTTKEPDDLQIEVAITALMRAEGLQKPENTIGDLLNIAAKRLKDKEIEAYMLDSQLLLANVLGKDKLYIITNRDKKVSAKDEDTFFELIKKREEKMPLKYILGETEFMGLDFFIEKGVLIPRPDTEVLVEEVLKLISEDQGVKVCDLCSGSGAIGIALANYKKQISVDAIDFYDVPEKVTKKNIKKHQLENRVNFIKSDLLTEVINQNKIYDIIVSNPPYIKDDIVETLMDDVKQYEPHTALAGGKDGLYFYRKIITQSKSALIDNGILAFEIGHDQGKELQELMQSEGFKEIKIIQDLAGLDRVVIGYFNC